VYPSILDCSLLDLRGGGVVAGVLSVVEISPGVVEVVVGQVGTGVCSTMCFSKGVCTLR
jgi:hypothetical protein